ncbi:hypothetical protein EJB05_30348, partial [Eragrostis curvula]
MALTRAETLRADLAEAAGSLVDRSFSVLSASSPATASATTSKNHRMRSEEGRRNVVVYDVEELQDPLDLQGCGIVGREPLAERRTTHPGDQDQRKFPNGAKELVSPRGGRTPGSARAGIAPGGLSFPGQGSLSSQTSP